jgi:hypothetical protein
MRRRLNALGYAETDVVPWDIDQFVHLPGGRLTGRRRPAELFPQRALLVGRRGAREPTLLEAVAEEFGRQVGRSVEYGKPLARQSSRSCARRRMRDQDRNRPWPAENRASEDSAERLVGGSPPPVAERVPWLLGAGEVGSAGWSAEERPPGSTAPHELALKLPSDCIDFLVALHVVERSRPAAPSTARRSSVVLLERRAA